MDETSMMLVIRLKFLLVFSVILFLNACGGSGGDTPNREIQDITHDTTTTSELSGSVGDGPIIGATITIRDNEGTVLDSTNSSSSAGYRISVRTGRNSFPLQLDAVGGTDIVSNAAPDFALRSIALSPSDKKNVNLNPYTTFIVRIAELMPDGLTTSNVEAATQLVISNLNFGLDVEAMSNPIGEVIDETNVANVIKSTEALGETIRRTRSALQMQNIFVSYEQLIDLIADDLLDGFINGRSSSAYDSRIAATWNLVSAEVGLEVMLNQIRVNGFIATQLLDNAIFTSAPDTPTSVSTSNVPINQQLIDSVEICVIASQTVSSNADLTVLENQVSSLMAGLLPQQIAEVIPENAPGVIRSIINLLPSTSPTTLNELNSIIATGTNDQGSDSAIVNTPPTISSTQIPVSVTAGNSLFLQIQGSDADGDSLSFSVTNLPGWAGFTDNGNNTATIGGIPSDNDIGIYSNIVVSVSDGVDSASLNSFSLEVIAAPVINTAPTISGIPSSSIVENNRYSFIPTAQDQDGDSLTFSIINQPAWASFNRNSGALSGTPDSTDIGMYSNIIIRVTDGVDTASLNAFSITVEQAPVTNSAPVISGNPTTSVEANSFYSFSPSAFDADGDSLTFYISNQPSWASFNPSNGTLSGTPTDGNVGTFSNIMISVSDGSTSSALTEFSITVTETPNTAPVISGNPSTSVTENQQYSFTPVASDADGDNLSFSISNLPSWASFNTSTGAINGTPTGNDVGIFSNIVVSVSDGTVSTSLNVFSIEVIAEPVPTTGFARLAWIPPTSNVDGTALTDLAGYKVYYGTQIGVYPTTITIHSPGISEYLVENLPGSNTYYFVVTAFDVNGNESPFSNVASKTIP